MKREKALFFILLSIFLIVLITAIIVLSTLVADSPEDVLLKYVKGRVNNDYDACLDCVSLNCQRAAKNNINEFKNYYNFTNEKNNHTFQGKCTIVDERALSQQDLNLLNENIEKITKSKILITNRIHEAKIVICRFDLIVDNTNDSFTGRFLISNEAGAWKLIPYILSPVEHGAQRYGVEF